MKYLSELTPAEVYVLTKDKFTHRELLKITFIDLLFKKVLRTFEVQRVPDKDQEMRTYRYIGIGQGFEKYPSRNHEKFFLSIFEKDSEMEMLFTTLTKVAYQKSITLSYFKNELIKTPTLKKCFSQNIFQRIFYGYSFTDYGKELKRKVEKEIHGLNLELQTVKNTENQKVIELIKVIGANIFFLENIDYEILNQFDSNLAIEMNRREPKTDGSGCSGCGWIFVNYSSHFDSNFNSDSGESSGCGSGCSGCGGCGGCS